MKDYKAPKMGGGVMGHEKMPKKVDCFAAQKQDIRKVMNRPMEKRGYPDAAFAYKY